MSYETFCYYYDSLMDPQFYEDYYQFIKRYYPVQDVLELGCGTGEIAIRLAQDNIQVFASDLSNEMIDITKHKAMQNNVPLLLQKVDMRDFLTSKKVDMILCLCDSINYLLKEDEVKQTFHNVYNSLDEQGIFIFDSNSIYKTETILKDYHEHNEDDEFIFDWRAFMNENQILEHRVYIKDILENEEVSETHFQKTFTLDQYLEWLAETGFQTIELFGDFEDYHDHCERIIFVCHKGEKR